MDRTINELKKKNFVNDEIFTESYLRSEIINKGKPAIRIIQKLRQKGVPEDIIRQATKEYKTDMQ